MRRIQAYERVLWNDMVPKSYMVQLQERNYQLLRHLLKRLN